jgi:ribonuclease HII
MEKLKSPQKPLKVKARSSQKLSPSFTVEKAFQKSGIVVGIDEVGRGCIAGPVVAAAVAFRTEDWNSLEPEMQAITDSKKIQEAKRQVLARWIRERALVCEIETRSSVEVDRLNILRATLAAFRGLLEKIAKDHRVDMFLIDGNQVVKDCAAPQHAIVSGDQRSKSIAAASVVAKVFRDNLMIQLDADQPGYGFASHKGYGTSTHYEAIERLGLLPEHRRSFLKNWNRLELGREGESLTAQYLEAQGFEILSRNLRSKVGEVDLIAKKNSDVHFVEVRSRRLASVEEAFPKSKQIQFQKAARDVAQEMGVSASRMRYDFAFVNEGAVEMYWDVFQW